MKRFQTKKSLDEVIRIKNLVPGTLVYKGEVKTEFSVNVTLYDMDDIKTNSFKTVEQLIRWISEQNTGGKVLWIDVIGLNHTAEIEKIGHYYNLDNLLLEQVINITKYSSYEYSQDYVFGDLQMIYQNQGTIINDNISLYAVDGMVLSFHENRSDVFTSIKKRIINAMGIIRNQSAYYLFYSLLDTLADNYLDVMNLVKHDILVLEEKIVNEEQLDIKRIHNNRKRLLHFKLAIAAFKKLADTMKSDQRFEFTEKKDAHMNNLHNHINELSNELILQQETVNVLYENHMLNNSNDMNSVMTTLTLFSAVFIPLSFLTGLFGMNFAHIPGLNEPGAFMYFLMGCGVMAVGMLTFFKVKKWF